MEGFGCFHSVPSLGRPAIAHHERPYCDAVNSPAMPRVTRLSRRTAALRTALPRYEHREWMFLRHEDLSADPESGFQAICQRTDIPFAGAAAEELRRNTATDNPVDAPRRRDACPDEEQRGQHKPLVSATRSPRDRGTTGVRRGVARVTGRLKPRGRQTASRRLPCWARPNRA
jgi:hypothetical protein